MNNIPKVLDMPKNISKTVKSVIAKECDVNRKSVTNKTPFMSKQTLPYFGCIGALFDLEHIFCVRLLESDYYKYKTVGDLIKNIVRQQRKLSK